MSELRAGVRANAELKPVRRVHEQVADQLRDLIGRGVLRPGDRLPTETALARELDVSRGSVREALRVLSAQRLIRTTKGATGGSFVTVPRVDHISEFIGSTLALLTESEDISLEELLEARELLEVPAARLAAERRGFDLERLGQVVPEEPHRLPIDEQFAYNKEFHVALVEAAGNALLRIAAEPIFSILQTHLSRSVLKPSFHRTVNAHHREIGGAVIAADADAAAELMLAHLDFLRPAYELAWRKAFRGAERATAPVASTSH
jgi:DNA-binding FadR family transcriptional regulator